MSVDIRKLLLTTVEMNASDLHIVTGEPPVVRVRGEIRRLNMPALSRSLRLLPGLNPSQIDSGPNLQKNSLSTSPFHFKVKHGFVSTFSCNPKV